MKKFLLLFTTILSSLYLVAQDSISVGFYVGASAVAFKETPAYMPRISSVSVFVANSFKRFRFDTGLRLTEDYYTLDKKESTGENYKATINATFMNLFGDAAFNLVSKKSHHSDLQLGVSLIMCFNAKEKQQHATQTISYNLHSNNVNVVVSCGYRVSFPLSRNWIINVTPNVNYKIFNVTESANLSGHGVYVPPYHVYGNFRFYYGIDIGLEYFFRK